MEENRLQIIVINLKMYIAILLNMTREKFKEKNFFFLYIQTQDMDEG